MEELIKEMNESGIFDFEVTKRNLFDCLDTYKSYLACKDCKGLNECKSECVGYIATLNGLKRCKYKKEKDLIEKKNNNLESMFFPTKLMNASLNDFEITNEFRSDVIKAFSYLITNNINKGLFLTGPNNQGKTYALVCIANEYKNIGKHVTLVFVPDLIRYLRTLRFSPEIENVIYSLKTTDVLMFDDLGIEIYDPWFSFEILTPILNYRLQEELITYFTSNYTIKEMHQNAPEKNIKDYQRLIRRIDSLCLRKGNEVKEFEIRRK